MISLFITLGLIYLSSYLLIARRRNNYILPLLPLVGYSFIKYCVTPIVLVIMGSIPETITSVHFLCFIFLLVYFFSLLLGFCIKIEYIDNIIFSFFSVFEINSNEFRNKRFNKILIISFSLFFIALCLSANNVLDWILHTRQAYQFQRKGNGEFYVLFCSFLMLSANFTFYSEKNSKKKYIKLFIYFFIAYFSGSKSFIIYILLMFLISENELNKRIKFRSIFIIGIIFIFLMGILMIFQGTSNSILGVIRYFDYYSNTIQFLENVYSKTERTLGLIKISSYWSYLPRSIFPNKPSVYGTSLINELLWPGLSESGHFPAFSEIVVPLMEYGSIGLFFTGFLKGYFINIKFRYFLKNKTFWSYILYLSTYLPTFYLIGGFMNYLFWLFIVFFTIVNYSFRKMFKDNKNETKNNI